MYINFSKQVFDQFLRIHPKALVTAGEYCEIEVYIFKYMWIISRFFLSLFRGLPFFHSFSFSLWTLDEYTSRTGIREIKKNHWFTLPRFIPFAPMATCIRAYVHTSAPNTCRRGQNSYTYEEDRIAFQTVAEKNPLRFLIRIREYVCPDCLCERPPRPFQNVKSSPNWSNASVSTGPFMCLIGKT